MQDPPLQLHELCKDCLSLGLHLTMQSHKLNTCYKPGRGGEGRGGSGEGRGREGKEGGRGEGRVTIKDRQAQPVPKRRSSLVQHTAHVVHYSTRGKEHHHFVSLCGRRENVTACTPRGEGGRTPCAHAGSPPGKRASPPPAPPTIRGRGKGTPTST